MQTEAGSLTQAIVHLATRYDVDINVMSSKLHCTEVGEMQYKLQLRVLKNEI